MNHISKHIQKGPLVQLQRQINHTQRQITAVRTAINEATQGQHKEKFNIIKVMDGVVTVEAERAWLYWLRGNEQEILAALQKINIQTIKWRSTTTFNLTRVKKKSHTKLSDKSAAVVMATAANIKSEKLKQSLINLAKRIK